MPEWVVARGRLSVIAIEGLPTTMQVEQDKIDMLEKSMLIELSVHYLNKMLLRHHV